MKTIDGSSKIRFVVLMDMQRELYLLMFRKGWYVLENTTQTKLDEKYKMLSSEYDSLGVN